MTKSHENSRHLDPMAAGENMDMPMSAGGNMDMDPDNPNAGEPGFGSGMCGCRLRHLKAKGSTKWRNPLYLPTAAVVTGDKSWLSDSDDHRNL